MATAVLSMMRCMSVNCDTQAGALIRRWAGWGGRGADLRRNNALWLHMPVFCCNEDCSYNVRAADIVAPYVDVSSSNFSATSLDFMAFDKSSDQLYLYIQFVYWVEKTIFERRLRARGDSCCFIN